MDYLFNHQDMTQIDDFKGPSEAPETKRYDAISAEIAKTGRFFRDVVRRTALQELSDNPETDSLDPVERAKADIGLHLEVIRELDHLHVYYDEIAEDAYDTPSYYEKKRVANAAADRYEDACHELANEIFMILADRAQADPQLLKRLKDADINKSAPLHLRDNANPLIEAEEILQEIFAFSDEDLNYVVNAINEYPDQLEKLIRR